MLYSLKSKTTVHVMSVCGLNTTTKKILITINITQTGILFIENK